MEVVLGCKTSNERDVRQTFKLVHGVRIPPFPGQCLSIPSGPGRWRVVLVTLCARTGVRRQGVSMGPSLDLWELQGGLSVRASEGARGVAHVVHHRGGRRVVCRLRGLHDVCPGLIHQEIQHGILSKPSVHLVAFLDEYGTTPAPTCMTLYPTRYTPWLRAWGAVCRPMSTCTGPARVLGELAVIG